MLIAMRNYNAQSFPYKVVRDFIALYVTGKIYGPEITDRFINWIGKSCFVECIDKSKLKHFVAVNPFYINHRLDFHHSFGKSACFIGTQYIHAAEVLN